MSTNFSYPWAPPSYMQVIFFDSDCNQMAILWQFYKQSNRTSVSKSTFYHAVLSGLQEYMNVVRFNKTPPSDQVVEWAKDTRVVERAVTRSFYNDGTCKNTICPLLGWEGNSDLAGRGMLTTYAVQAVLVTFYLLMLLVFRSDKKKDARSKPSFLSRTSLAVQHSTAAFLNASSVFSIAMLFASLISFAPGDNQTQSAVVLMLLMPIGSVLPMALLQIAASDILRRNLGRLLLWMLTFILMITVLTMVLVRRVSLPHTSGNSRDQLKWEVHCIDGKNVWNLLIFAITLASALILGVGSYVSVSLMMKLRRRPVTSWCMRTGQPLWWGGLVLAFIAMWLNLGWFIRFRSQMNNKAGKADKDMVWSFGQVLSIATWVPVIVELAYAWWEGPEKALNGRLMDPYEVKEVSKEIEAFEMDRRRGTV